MNTSVRSGMAPRLGRLAAVGALALLLTGAVADPAAARPRSPATAVANGMIAGCFEMGGDPSGQVHEGYQTVSCLMPNGSVINCAVIESPYPDAICNIPGG